MAEQGTLPVWQEAYIREVRRTSGKGVRFAACGGGWYALYFDGDTSALKQRVRRSDIVSRTALLQTRPDSGTTPKDA